jgi:pimeloyl-ACP methyl ester carboxylesterase
MVCCYYGIACQEVFAQTIALNTEISRYAVGFTTTLLIDNSRQYHTEASIELPKGRPIRLYIWYPTEPTLHSSSLHGSSLHGSRVLFGEYVYWNNLYKEPSALTEREKLACRNTFLATHNDWKNVSPQQTTDLFAMQTRAFYAPKPSKGKFPVIVVPNAANGGGYFFSTLCEFLAAQGYIVVTVPSFGKTPDTPCPFAIDCAEEQFNDVQVALQHVCRMPSAQPSAIGVMSWSFGGITASLLAMRDSRVKAVVSLDAAIGYQYGQEILEQSQFYKPQRMKAPFLHIHGLGKSRFLVPKSFSWFRALPVREKFLFTDTLLKHSDFVPVMRDMYLFASGSADTAFARSFRNVSNNTLDFFEAYLKKNSSAQRRLQATKQQMPTLDEALLQVRVREMNTAFAKADTQYLATRITEDYLHINGSSPPVGRTAWLQYVAERAKNIENGLLTINRSDIEDMHIRMYNGYAIAHGKNIIGGEENGSPFLRVLRKTELWVQEHGDWKRAAFHDTRIE